MDIGLTSLASKKAKKPKLLMRIIKIFGGIGGFFSVLLFVILIGAAMPSIPYLGLIGTIAVTFLTTDLLICCLIICILLYLTIKAGGKLISRIILVLSVINLIGYSVPAISLINTAHKYNADVSLIKSMELNLEQGTPDMSKSVKYASIDGKNLFMQITLPKRAAFHKKLVPVVVIHGGGYVSGERNENPLWTKFYNSIGCAVFDVDYRLGSNSYHTWDKAPKDIATAIVWIGQNAKKYNLNMKNLIISGGSAGGGLALQTAYGIADNTVKAYIKGLLVRPKFVIALYPEQDLKDYWKQNNILTSMAHKCNNMYIGGSPEDYPKEYAAILPQNHITKNTPPTLIFAGESDHLIAHPAQVRLYNALVKNKIPAKLVSLPFTEHAYDVGANGLATQITLELAKRFIKNYLTF